MVTMKWKHKHMISDVKKSSSKKIHQMHKVSLSFIHSHIENIFASIFAKQLMLVYCSSLFSLRYILLWILLYMKILVQLFEGTGVWMWEKLRENEEILSFYSRLLFLASLARFFEIFFSTRQRRQSIVDIAKSQNTLKFSRD